MEPDNKRKELYGKAGAFREKPYGVEYRTISNYYLQSKKLIYWVFDQTQAAINFVNNQTPIDDFLQEVVQTTINTSNKQDALALVKDYKLKLAI